MRYLAILLITIFVVPAHSVAADAIPPQIGAFLKKHCTGCHGAMMQKGDLRLDQVTADFKTADGLEVWGQILEKLEKREMPPKAKPQPSEAERKPVLDWLQREMETAVTTKNQAEGRVPLRRLNRVEYQNTIHALLGIETNVMELLPEDGSALGFDKVSTALTLSSVQVEKYLEAADLALDAALGVGPRPRTIDEHYGAKELLASWDNRSHRSLESGDIVFFNSGYSPTELRRFRAPAPGRYRIRVSAYGFQTEGKPAAFRLYGGNFGVGGKTKLLQYAEVPADKPAVVEVVERLDGRNDTLKVVPYGTINWQNSGETHTGPGLAVQWIEVTGPLEATEWPPATRRQLLGDVDLDRGTFTDAEKVLSRFAARAFRRPVTTADVAPYLKLVRERIDKNVPFGDALRVGLKAILVSPRFLLLDEQPGKLDGYALAARLSYFLWNTMPDEELLVAAAKGNLSQPVVLRAQVERMLSNPQASAFTEDFTGQWLSLRNIEFTSPDARLYPEFDEWLQVSMLRETHAFFDELLKHDFSILNFVESDFAMLNERMAKHYGIPGVTGLEMRRVALQPEWHRGGVLTQASVLKVTANGTTTSPVIRGAWIADRILGQPVPPPPANVPAVEPDIRGTKTIREQLSKHRDNEACAVCHTRMDPLGFALESYDVIGGWRDRYRISPERGQRVESLTLVVNQRDFRIAIGPRVDPSDTLADGREFRDIAELKQLLLKDPEQVTRCIAEKLLIYATGQGLEATDHAVLSKVVENVKSKNYGFRSLVQEVVQSSIFQTK